MKLRVWRSFAALAAVVLVASISHAEVRVLSDRTDGSAEFAFNRVPSPSRSDAAMQARFTVVDGRADGNGGGVEKLHDGKIPTEEDQPAENFFFRAGTDGGRLLIDLGGAVDIKQVNTYSWHPGRRGPQVYDLYGGGGQYGVSVCESEGTLGAHRYLLLDVFRTEAADPFGNTFYSEIDVVDPTSPVVVAKPATEPAGEVRREVVEIEGGKYQITIDTTETPDLTKGAIVHE